ncbi:sodium:solute symporter [Marinoscillum furvescens]|uniref:SSS family transporter n=1 Tax=Marinoscillum furvescens DSM 4134 TaxID=1122208 RepID=A0A3D9L2K2_MARFU|nr:sodium:solute symporter [Marinoscillum furvescens]RED97009.1 SSS family transporter [Marinoscillum furvescens DSM 4134]
MNTIDLIVLFGTLGFIVSYGVWKTRGQKNLDSYLLGDQTMKWGTIGLSVMATQASAITFISTPGQGYESGMGFVQNYFGLPLALIIVSAVFIPIFYKLKVYTAYEYLESRFDLKTRLLGAFLFLIQRGLAAGITIYAPAIILSSILEWNLTATILVTGTLVIIYTVSGGTKAVSITQKQQMAVIMGGMFVAFFMIISYITDFVSFGDAVVIAGKLEKLNAVDLDLNFEKRYTLWSGLAGGLFLALSYFGTDQSQVQRYLGGKNVTESRMGLMFNAVLKIPMQFFILFVGVMVYVFYLFYTPPVHFKDASIQRLKASDQSAAYLQLENEYNELIEERKQVALSLAEVADEAQAQAAEKLRSLDAQSVAKREEVKAMLLEMDPAIETKDSDYVFLTFILTYLPHGLIGLLIAVIFSAAMSSTSSELSALSSTTSVDFAKRLNKSYAGLGNGKQVWLSKLITLCWGILAISFALLAKNSENLIEAVNIVGSIFYGTILGIFLVAFFFRFVKGTAVFVAAIIAQLTVIVFHFLTVWEMITLGYLWYNAIGCALTILLSIIFQSLDRSKPTNS